MPLPTARRPARVGPTTTARKANDMAKRKLHAGLYQTQVKAGVYTIRNTGPKSWVVTTASNRRIGKFPSLGEANAWLAGLTEQPASVESKNYLRDLLDQQAGTPLAERLRGHFNGLRASGALITQSDVSQAIDRLKGRPAGGLPRQRRATARPAVSVLPKAEAIRFARASLRPVVGAR